MSSEEASYEVIENLRRIEQARMEAWDEARTLETAARGLADRVEAACRKYGQGIVVVGRDLPARPAHSVGLREVEAYVGALREYCNVVQEGLGRAIATAETRLLLAEIGKHAARQPSQSDDLFGVPRRHMDAAEAPDREVPPRSDKADREREVMRVLGRLNGTVPEPHRRDMERLAAEIVQMADSGRAAALASELRLRVQRANENAEAKARDIARATAAREGLRGLDGDDVTAVISELNDVERGQSPLTEALLLRAQQVEQAARARADRNYAADVIREELARLGYEVEEDFASLFVSGGEAHIRKPQLPDYRVVMQLDSAAARMDVRLTRLGRPGEPLSQEQRLRDGQTEESWCRDFAELRKAVERRKVASRVLRRAVKKSEFRKKRLSR
jgi:hypothetical protein